MLHFIICDDVPSHNMLTAKRLRSVFEEHCLPGKIVLTATTSREVLGYAEVKRSGSHHLNIYLLDIDLKDDLNGIELAKSIRQVDSLAYLVFITGDSSYALESFKLKTFDYLVKPLDRAALEALVLRIYRDAVLTRPGTKAIAFTVGSSVHRINSVEIIFIESFGNKVVVHCRDKLIETYMSLSEIEQQLQDEGFFRCHRSYLLNLRHLSSIDLSENKAIMSSGEECLIARRHRKGLIQFVDHRV